MRRAIWLWVVVAFLVGLAPGAALFWWKNGSYNAARGQLISRNAQLGAENQSLTTKLHSAEASVSALAAQLAAPPTPSAATTPTSSSGAQPKGLPNITGRTVSPSPVAPGAKLALTVKLTGHADKVNLRIATVSGQFDKTYFLARLSFDSSGEVWGKTITAPPSADTYRFFAIAYSGGQKYPMPGILTFDVK